jgi:septal ring factor EnvC (AmiA/AmiB activator)
MGAEREDQLNRLAEADSHIAEAEHAVTEQMSQVAALRLAGKDTTGAERELTAFQETLAVLQDHRASINKAIEQIDGRIS